MKKVFFSDIDGTLLKTNTPLHQNAAAAIRNFMALGGAFSLCTGRAAQAAEPLAKALEINLPCIVLGGALIYDFSAGRTLWEQPLHQSWRKLVQAVYENEPQVGITVYTKKQILSLRKDSRILARGVAEDKNAPPCRLGDIDGDIYKILLTAEDTEVFPRIGEKYTDSRIFHLCPASPHFHEITDAAVNKGAAAKKLIELCGLVDSAVYAAGDGGTDLLLKNAASQFFAPETAPQYIKDQADFIFPPPIYGGIAAAIERALTL